MSINYDEAMAQALSSSVEQDPRAPIQPPVADEGTGTDTTPKDENPEEVKDPAAPKDDVPLEDEKQDPEAPRPEKDEDPEAPKGEEDSKSSNSDTKSPDDWRKYPRAAQRAIHRANKKLRAEQEKARALEEELMQAKNLVPDPDVVREDHYRQKEISMRTQIAQQRFSQQVQTLSPEEQRLIIEEGDGISLEDKPITALALLEHQHGARLALEIVKDPRLGDLFEEADDRQALKILDALARNLSQSSASMVPKKTAPKKVDTTPTAGKAQGSKVKTPIEMDTKEFANWLGM